MNIINPALALPVYYSLEANPIFFAQSSVVDTSSMKKPCKSPESLVIDAVQEFGRKISYGQWAKNPNTNVVLSPLSIITILNLMILGTGGRTNSELQEALNYSSKLSENVIHETFQNFFRSLNQSSNGVEISLHTRLFLQSGFSVLKSYKDISKTSYFTEVQNLNFQGSPNAATEEINRWVSMSTKGKISSIFDQPLRRDSICVACNVIFLNATWEQKFDSRGTRNGTFNTGKEDISIPMMTKDGSVPYLRNDDNKRNFEMISLPYEGKRYSMYILKPAGNAGISNLLNIENNLNSTYLKALINQMNTERVIVTIPRMRLSQDLDLKMDLNILGVNQIFNQNLANFERFTDKKGMFVSDIFHKAILEVTEEGTSAAAVSALVISQTSLPPRFILDKPSLLFIRDNENGLILFWAKVIKPEPLLD